VQRAAAWSDVERLATCGPRPGVFWLFSSGHKTGTELMDHVAEAIAGPDATWLSSLGSNGIDQACFSGPDAALLGSACLAAAKAHAHRILVGRSGPLSEARLMEAKGNLQQSRHAVRVLLSMRDPLEIVKSAFFYHARGAEPSQRAVPSDWIGELKARCRGEREQWYAQPGAEACAAVLNTDEATTSYAAMLQWLPPYLGIEIEATNSISHGLERVATARAVEAAHPAIVTTLALEDVFESFDEAFGRLFRFLGVADDDVGACLATIRHLDVSSVRGSTTHDACMREHAPADDVARLEQMRARLAPPWEAITRREGWYDEFVAPLRALSPRECSDPHVSDPDLSGLKSELEAVLRASPFYEQHLSPLRLQAGYGM
tara:strand:- start:219 stop:1343 length:1125 start_codon:yes stop_codon:yes gene_type:complete